MPARPVMPPAAFDIAPFGLPNCGPGEVRSGELLFEEPRDIVRVVVTFSGSAPAHPGLSYLVKRWPKVRLEQMRDIDNPCAFGWTPIDDWFNSEWRPAAIAVRRAGRGRAAITFSGLSAEFPDAVDYDVAFRRTLGVRVDVPDAAAIRRIEVYTASPPARTRLRVELDAGRKTAAASIGFDAYNARVGAVKLPAGTALKEGVLQLRAASRRTFELDVEHMRPAHRYCGDDGHVRFVFDRDSFTISLSSLERQGPVWFAEKGVFITRAGDPTTFAAYRAACAGAKTVAAMVRERPEQTLSGACTGQPRPHVVGTSLGCKYARQRFWMEPNGDIVLRRWNVASIPANDTPRFANEGDGRFFFGLENWLSLAYYPDPSPVPAQNVRARRGPIDAELRAFAVPLERSILAERDAPRGDETIVCLLRVRLTNAGPEPAAAEFPIAYSRCSGRNATGESGTWGVPRSDLAAPGAEPLQAPSTRVYGSGGPAGWQGKPALRCVIDTAMGRREEGGRIVLSKLLAPGESCQAVLKIPFISLDAPDELRALDALDFDRSGEELARFWREEVRRGARLATPEPRLDDVHANHLVHVQTADVAMPGDPALVNTSVGSSLYGNFSNESCMIIEELEQRGLVDDARRRLEVWLRYQGTRSLPGNYTDHDGVFYGAGGFECGDYNQHHGFVLWRVAGHFLRTRDRAWFGRAAGALIAGADWVFRQRRGTMRSLPHSRGWERGFLPAGSLEDVTDFLYWLSTNALTWRGVDAAAQALEAFGHTEAGRVRREADAYRRDLRRGFDTMRQHSPLVRLRDGRWVPHFPSRLYCRGRDVGWIREVLEGSIYLLISGLYSPASREAGWILDDYQDNRYLSPPYGYAITDWDREWFSHGGFSIQPCLLAGLMPYLDRDEPELYIWSFFNAFAACYREEIGGLTEHPAPVLGYSNGAQFKTSDEANAVMWLRYMLVYAAGGTLHFGRAIPRAWLRPGGRASAERVLTVFGDASVAYSAAADGTRISAAVTLRPSRAPAPERVLVRFRHPERKPIAWVTVGGQRHDAFDPCSGDVDVTGRTGTIEIVAGY